MPGEKYFLWNAIPNLILILYLLYYLSIRQGVGSIVAALFVYLSLHGGYAIFAAATGDGINTLNTLHFVSSDLGAKLSAAFFITCCGILLINRLHHPFQSLQGSSKLVSRMGYALLLFSLFMAIGAATLPNISRGTVLTIYKESFFAVSMWIGAIVFAIIIKQNGKYFIAFRREWVAFLLVISILMVVSGFYEIATGVVWAGTSYSYGFSYRASGMLFNPNVLGFWCALMAALVSLIYHIRWISRPLVFGFMLLFTISLILSSSRSGLMLLLINLVAISVFIPLNRKFIGFSIIDSLWPLFSFVLAFVLCALTIEYFNSFRYSLANTLHINLLRFIQLPQDIYWVLMIKVIFPLVKNLDAFSIFLIKNYNTFWIFIEKIFSSIGVSIPTLSIETSGSIFSDGFKLRVDSVQNAGNDYLKGHMNESVDGRLLSQYSSDNSFLSIYAIGGIVSILIWLWLWLVLIWLGVSKYLRIRSIYSCYALVGLIFCFTSGFFLRSPQLFPVWIFLSMVLGACLCWWLLIGIDDNLRQRETFLNRKLL